MDGVVKAYISDETGWANVNVEVTGSGEHTITWTYLNDDAEGEEKDCFLIAGYRWASFEPYTHSTDVPVPYAWLLANCPDAVDEYASYEAAVKQRAANLSYTV